MTVTGATDAIKLGSASFTGVDQSSPLDAYNTARGSSGNPTISTTTVTAYDVVVATLSRFSTTDATTNRTELYKDRVTSTLAAGSYQLTTSAGSYSDTYTGSAALDWSMVLAAFKPASTAGGSGTTTTHIIHTDHLGGTNVVTDNNGDLVQTLDYYPYGSLRLNTRSTNLDEKRKFTGHEYDSEVGLTYMRARYYDASRGQFLSEDPVFLGVGLNNDPKKIEAYLSDPQNMHSYAYARNNPLFYVDPDGQLSWPFNYKTTVSLGKTALGLGVKYVSYKAQQEYRAFLEWEKEHKEGIILVLSLAGEGPPKEAEPVRFNARRIRIKTELEDVRIKSFGKTLYEGSRNLRPVVEDIEAGRISDRGTYNNDTGLLPKQTEGYYKEYEVPNTPNYDKPGAGPERIIRGEKGELYYTPDHYETFHKLNDG